MDKVSVFCLIVTFNGSRWIRKCLDSVLRDAGIDLKVVAIDNGSSDGTLTILHEEYPEVHVIENGTNRGFGYANNRGLEYAYKQGATHFLLLNQDAFMLPGAVGKLVEVQQEGAFPLVSPIHMNGTGKMLDHAFYHCISRAATGKALLSDMLNETPKDSYECPFVNAACWLIPRPTVERIGGFDPLFFHYGEDNDYCKRIIWHGGSPVIVPAAVMCHDRERRGNEAMWEKNRLLSFLLLMYGIDSKPRRERIKFHYLNLKTVLFNLLTFHWNNVKPLLHGYHAFFKRLPAVKEHVRNNRETAPNWLSLKEH